MFLVDETHPDFQHVNCGEFCAVITDILCDKDNPNIIKFRLRDIPKSFQMSVFLDFSDKPLVLVGQLVQLGWKISVLDLEKNISNLLLNKGLCNKEVKVSIVESKGKKFLRFL